MTEKRQDGINDLEKGGEFSVDQLTKLRGIVLSWLALNHTQFLRGSTIQIEPVIMITQLEGGVVEYNHRIKLHSGKCEADDVLTKNLLVEQIKGMVRAIKPEAKAVMFWDVIGMVWDPRSQSFKGTILVLM